MALLIITIISFYLFTIWFRASLVIIRNLMKAFEGIAWLALIALGIGMYQNPELTMRVAGSIFKAIIWIAEGVRQIIISVANAHTIA